MIELDGSHGEGGGQIIRTALALSTLAQQPFHAASIRSGRKESGLKMQHLHCIKALQKLSGAEAEGAFQGSTEITFVPGRLGRRSLSVDIGTAGSITLFLQAVLMPCCFADRPVRLEITGGTDVAWSMPADYFREVLVPHLGRWAGISVKTMRRGCYPKGNGNMVIRIKPRISRNDFKSLNEFLQELRKEPRLQLAEQGHLIYIKGISYASKSLESAGVAERQAHAAQQALSRHNCPVSISSEYAETLSPGSGITVWAVFSKNREDIDPANPMIIGADALGEKGTPAENIGKAAAQKLYEAIISGAATDAHLADNLIPWMALYPPSTITTAAVTKHATTNIYVAQKFLPARFTITGNRIASA